MAIHVAAAVVAAGLAYHLKDGESPESALEAIAADFRDKCWKQYKTEIETAEK
jgi:hypothetical protein